MKEKTSNNEVNMAKKKDKYEDPMEAIRAFEKSNAAPVDQNDQQDQVFTFEEWWSMRSSQISQPAYVKEIIKTDAKARGVSGSQTMAKWDGAARAYGLKL